MRDSAVGTGEPLVSAITIFLDAESFLREAIEAYWRRPTRTGSCCWSTMGRPTEAPSSRWAMRACIPSASATWSTMATAIGA